MCRAEEIDSPDKNDVPDTCQQIDENPTGEGSAGAEDGFFEDLQHFEGENAEDRGRGETIAGAKRFDRGNETWRSNHPRDTSLPTLSLFRSVPGRPSHKLGQRFSRLTDQEKIKISDTAMGKKMRFPIR